MQPVEKWRREMQILVTGATGFVGRHVVNSWSQQLPEAEIWRLVHEGAEEDLQSPTFFTGDLREAAVVRQVCQHLHPDWVVHLAAQSFVPDSLSDPQETWKTNLGGTFHLLEALREHGFTGRFLFVGSGDQYGKVEEQDVPIRETQPLRPGNPYAASKAAAELLCYQYSETYGFDVILTRSFNHIGPGQSPRFVVSDFARQVAQIELGMREPVLRVGNLDVTRDFLAVHDVVDAYRALLERGRKGEVYNVCSGHEIRLLDLVTTLTGFSHHPIVIQVDPSRFRPSDTPRLCGSHDKLTQHTGWQPQREILASLAEVFAYWKEELRR